jgi:hypothetical protein
MVTLLRAETASTPVTPKPKATSTLARVKAASTEVAKTISLGIITLEISEAALTPVAVTVTPVPSTIVTLDKALAAETPVGVRRTSATILTLVKDPAAETPVTETISTVVG